MSSYDSYTISIGAHCCESCNPCLFLSVCFLPRPEFESRLSTPWRFRTLSRQLWRYGDVPQRMFMNEGCMIVRMYLEYWIKKNKCKKEWHTATKPFSMLKHISKLHFFSKHGIRTSKTELKTSCFLHVQIKLSFIPFGIKKNYKFSRFTL
jgi:hypothetical protein